MFRNSALEKELLAQDPSEKLTIQQAALKEAIFQSKREIDGLEKQIDDQTSPEQRSRIEKRCEFARAQLLKHEQKLNSLINPSAQTTRMKM